MNDKTLPEYIKEIKDLNERANVNVAEVPRNSQIAAETSRQMAIRELEKVTKAFHQAVEANLVGIFVFGPKAGLDAFTAIAEDDAAALTVDASEVYVTVAKATMEGARAGTEIGVNQVANFMSAVHGMASSLGARLPLIQFNQAVGFTAQKFDDIVDLVRQTVQDAVGDELNVLYLRRKLSQKVLDLSSDNIQTKVPVVVLNATKAESQGQLAQLLFGSGNLVVDVRDEVEKSQVIRAFKQLKEQLKKKG